MSEQAEKGKQEAKDLRVTYYFTIIFMALGTSPSPLYFVSKDGEINTFYDFTINMWRRITNWNNRCFYRLQAFGI